MIQWMRRRQRRTMIPRGQMAVGYVVLMGIVLVFVGMTINLGQMAQVRTAVSNSADAGALAGASWVASGENEAAMIAQKMWDGIAMVQAIYLVPFCPETNNTPSPYARALWSHLYTNNFWFFRPIANDVMNAAWNIGRREAFTATVNNVLARFPCSPDERAPDGKDWSSSGDKITKLINTYQHWLEDETRSFHSMGFGWTNCRPNGDPLLLRHEATYYPTYPSAAPTLVLQGWPAGSFYQYDSEIKKSVTGGHFDCSFSALGIDGGPMPQTLTIDPAVSYGGMDANGRKNWDVPLRNIYPPFGNNIFTDIVVRTCSTNTCGMSSYPADPDGGNLPLAPRTFTNRDGNVQVRIFHNVTRQNGAVDPLFKLPMWEQAFPEVGASARADYTGPQDADLGQNVAIRRTARAQLTQAQ